MIGNDKILILYHSGAGSTKTLSEIFYKMLDSYPVDISPINLEYDYRTLRNYSFIIFAFPTYHCSPSLSMMEFINNMPVFDEPQKAFAFTTCGLYSGNTLREFIHGCMPKNIVIGGCSIYRAPASDGALLLPPLSFMFRYERNIVHNITKDIDNIENIIRSDHIENIYPHYKLYTILNYPNKILGKSFKPKIKLLNSDCVNCGKCVDGCIRHCWVKGTKHPEYNGANCEFCFRCIHHCPKGAIEISEKTKTRCKLNDDFYKFLKEEIIKELLSHRV